MPAALPFATVFGLLIGSFLNVVAFRLPRKESLAFPPSHCTTCDAAVKPYDNIPVFSYLLLRGKCRSCAEPISARYPLVEAITAALFAAVVAVHHNSTHEMVMGLVLVAFLVPMAMIDLEHRIIPNKLTGPAAVVGLILGTALDPSGEPGRLLAAVIGGGILALPAFVMPHGMGMGDAKLVGVMGLYLGASLAPAFMAAFLIGTIVGLAIMAKVGLHEGRKKTVPFGPFLAIGGVIGVLAGTELVDLYLTTF